MSNEKRVIENLHQPIDQWTRLVKIIRQSSPFHTLSRVKL